MALSDNTDASQQWEHFCPYLPSQIVKYFVGQHILTFKGGVNNDPVNYYINSSQTS